MKYFTPSLLAECRSLDPGVAERAAAKWEGRADAYRKRLREIHDRLPRSVRSLLRFTTLHDAKLLTINIAKERGQAQLFLSYQLAGGKEQAGAQLRYEGLKKLKVEFHEPNASGELELFALYDEFDVSPDHTLTHSVLMTGGVEIRVRFARLHITRFTDVVVPGRGRSDTKERLVEMAAS